MNLRSPAIVIDAPNIATSRDFLTSHLGFDVSAEGEGRLDQAPVENRQMQIGYLVKDVDAHWDVLGDTVIDPTAPLMQQGSGRSRSSMTTGSSTGLSNLSELG